jgi:hypothetical protein
MRSLLRLLIAVIVLGSAVQQGWLQAATGFVVESLGGPAAAADPVARLDLALLLIRLNIGRLAKFKFSSGPYEIILEPLALTIFLGLIFFSLKNLPYLPLQKGQLFILITLICVIAHGVYTLVMASPNSYDEEQS